MDVQRKTEPGAYERQVFGMRVLRPSHPRLRQLRRQYTPSFQGHRLWNATWLLLSYLESHAPVKTARVMEVGCGWGLASVYCARVCGATVTSVDLDPQVFPFLKLNAEINEVKIEHFGGGFDQVDAEMLGMQDIVIGADICFHSQMIQPLFDLISRARRAGTRRIVLSDPGRMAFRSLASRCVNKLGASEMAWQVEEPMLSWPGEAPTINGRLLVIER